MIEEKKMEEAKKSLIAVFSLAASIESAIGKGYNLWSMISAYKALKKFKKTSGARQIKQHVKALSPEQKRELLVWAEHTFELQNEHVEDAIETCVEVYAGLKKLSRLVWLTKLKP